MRPEVQRLRLRHLKVMLLAVSPAASCSSTLDEGAFTEQLRVLYSQLLRVKRQIISAISRWFLEPEKRSVIPRCELVTGLSFLGVCVDNHFFET